jgi:hypothetical protein
MTKSYIFVGPALFGGARQETVEFPWDQLDASKPLVYVSMGTLYHQVWARKREKKKERRKKEREKKESKREEIEKK